jgi:hypothetical protein
MNHSSNPRSIQVNISTQQVGQELLVYDETRHKAFCLNATSAAIWKRCDGVHSIRQISAAATLELAAPVTDEMVLFALAELTADGLLHPESVPVRVPAMSRRQLVQRLGVGAAMMVPVVAAVMAPPAAQAYSGCFDCDVKPIGPGVAPVSPSNPSNPSSSGDSGPTLFNP